MKKAFLLAMMAALPLSAAESPISRKLQSIASSLSQGYARKSDAAKESLAVLSFSSSEKLAKARAGFAVSELLTHFFAQRPEFTLVERNLLHKLEEEQKFQAMAADTATAVKIGKVLGAKLLVMGSVEKAGGAYQVNARLVRTETGEVVATAFEELPASSFEEEARPYMNLVPERQGIGFYTAYQVRGKAKADQSYRNNGYEASPHDFDVSYFGGGLRYFPHQNILLDLGFFVTSVSPVVMTETYISGYRYDLDLKSNSRFLRGAVLWTSPIYPRWRWEAGIGIVRYSFDVMASWHAADVSVDSTHASLRLGLEFRPQQRLGLGLAVNNDLGAIKGKYSSGGEAFTLSALSLEPSLALYF